MGSAGETAGAFIAGAAGAFIAGGAGSWGVNALIMANQPYKRVKEPKLGP